MSIPNDGSQAIANSGDSKDTSTPSSQDSNDTLTPEEAKKILVEIQKEKADLERRRYEQDKAQAEKDPSFLKTLDTDRADKIVKSITDGKYKSAEEYLEAQSDEDYDPKVWELKRKIEELEKATQEKDKEGKRKAWDNSLQKFLDTHSEFKSDEDGKNRKVLMTAIEKLKEYDNYDEMLEDAYALVKNKLKRDLSLPSSGYTVPAGVKRDSEMSMEDYFMSTLKKNY